MKFLVTSKKKATTTTTKSSGDEPQHWPLPSPPPGRIKPEGYSLPVDSTSQPPLRTISRLVQASPRSELRITSTQMIATGRSDNVPVSPKMVREEEKRAPYLKGQENAMWRWPSQPLDSERSITPQRDSSSTQLQSSFTNRRECYPSRPAMQHVLNGSANRHGAASQCHPNGFREQGCNSNVDWRADNENEWGSSQSYELSPRTSEVVENSSTSPAREFSRGSTPQWSPQKHLMGSEGMKSGGPQFRESYQKPCKLPLPSELTFPSPTRSSHQLDRRTQTFSSTTGTVSNHDSAYRPRSLPSQNSRGETSPFRYKAATPSSPQRQQRYDQKLIVTSVPPCPRNLTPPSSPRPIQADKDKYCPSPRRSPQRSVLTPTSPSYSDYVPSPRNSPQHSTFSSSPGNSSPRYRVVKPPQRWKRGAKIGSGSFGCVYEGWNLDDGTFFAVKVSNGDHIPPEIHQEVAVLSKLRHPNIVQYYGTTTENGSICIFLELVKMGSLQSIMKNFQVFDEVLMSSYTRQILTGLEYLHDMNTIHRDIKCANILVDSDGQVKLADFGLAKQMKESLATSIKGSPYYMAPEVLLPGRNKRPYGLAVDIWSLGCTVLEMADGKPPWSGLQGYAFFFKVTNGELPPIPEHLSDTAKDFIIRCLQKRPEDRPTVKELLKHPFAAEAPRTFRACFPILVSTYQNRAWKDAEIYALQRGTSEMEFDLAKTHSTGYE